MYIWGHEGDIRGGSWERWGVVWYGMVVVDRVADGDGLEGFHGGGGVGEVFDS